MALFREIGSFFVWLASVLGMLFRSHPILTPALIVARSSAHVTRLLAFFVPLKVLLLVASPDVPRYFRFFVDPEHRNEWIIGLSAAAVGAYLLTMVLDKLVDRWAEVGSRELLQRSSLLSVIGNQRVVAKRYYAGFSTLAANLFLALVMFSIGFYFYPNLFAFLAGFLLLQIMLTWAFVRLVDPMEPTGFGGYVLRRPNHYVGHLETVGFLAVFVFLVSDFLVFGGVNILAAILSFLMTRRLLSSLASAVTEGVALMRQRQRIDPLIFLEEKHVKRQSGSQLKLNRHFAVEDRRERLLEVLSLAISDVTRVESTWVDGGPAGNYLFQVDGWREDGSKCFGGLEQVVTPRSLQALENELLIVKELGRATIRAPRVVQEYEVGDFRCRLLDLCDASPVSIRDWRNEHQPALVLGLWGIDPGRELGRIFALSKPYLQERITEESLEVLEVAADTADKVETLAQLKAQLPEIASHVAGLPLFPFNRNLNPGTVYVTREGEYWITDWGRWSLEPIGVGLEPEAMDETLAEKVKDKLQCRKWAGAMPTLSQLRIATLLFSLEDQMVNRSRFNESLAVAKRLLFALDEHNKAGSVRATLRGAASNA